MKKYCQICGSKEDLCPCKDEEFNETSYMCLRCVNEALGVEKQLIKMIVCPICNKSFLPKKKKQRMCSRKCVGVYVGSRNAKQS